MHVVHKSRVPIHVIGYGSSGTSIFCQLLREKLGVGVGTESQFVIRYYHALSEYGDLEDDKNLRRLIADLSRERWFERNAKFGFTCVPEQIFDSVRQRTYRGVLDATFSQLAEHLDAERWGDKTPDYVHSLAILWELFPDAKYIHMVRDGRDVAQSVMSRYWGPKNIFTAASEWTEQVSLVRDFLKTVPADQKLEVRYEDLLAEPITVFRELIEFLEVEDSDGRVLQRIEQTVPSELNRENSNKWKKFWTPAQRLAYERIGCDVLRHYGYETQLESRQPPSNGLAKAFWRIDNHLRKLAGRAYWKDNLYKSRLRIAYATQKLRNVLTRRTSV